MFAARKELRTAFIELFPRQRHRKGENFKSIFKMDLKKSLLNSDVQTIDEITCFSNNLGIIIKRTIVTFPA